MTSRAYDNRRREARSAATAERIVEAMVAAMAEGREDVSVAELAAASGVSLRTVYQHFPDKAARVAAINEWLSVRVNTAVMLPRNAAAIPDFVASTVDYIFDNETLVRAQMHPGLASAVRIQRKQPQLDALRGLLAPRLGMEEGRRLAALIVATLRAEAILDLRDIYGQSREEIKTGMVQLVDGLLERVTRASH